VIGKAPARPVSIAVYARGIIDDARKRGCDPYYVSSLKKVLSILQNELLVCSSRELEVGRIFARLAEFCSLKGYKPDTLITYNAILCATMRIAVRLRLQRRLPPNMPKQPDRRVKGRSPRSTPPPPQLVNQLLLSLRDARGTWLVGRLYVLAALMVYAGMTLRGALRLRVSELRLDDGFIDIRYPVRKSSVSLPIPPELAPILSEWVAGLPVHCDNVLPGVKMRGQWYETTKGSFNPHYQLDEFCRSRGIDGLTFEQLRRYHVERPRRTDFGLDGARASKPLPSLKIVEPKTLLLRGEPICEVTDVQRRALELLISKHPTRVHIDVLGKSAAQRIRDLCNRHPVLLTGIDLPASDGWNSNGYGLKDA
jgi:integrase